MSEEVTPAEMEVPISNGAEQAVAFLNSVSSNNVPATLLESLSQMISISRELKANPSHEGNTRKDVEYDTRLGFFVNLLQHEYPPTSTPTPINSTTAVDVVKERHTETEKEKERAVMPIDLVLWLPVSKRRLV